MKHPRANGLLKQIVEGTFGSDEIRLCAFRILLDKGVLDRNSSHKIWVRGKWTEVKAQQLDVTSEAESAPLPTGLDGLYDDALRATHRHRWSEGERLWRKIIAQAPAFHPAYYNLAVVLIRQEKTDEAETCLRKALEIDPGYIFAPCTLAILCLGKGRTAEAQSLLDAVIIPEKVHPSAMAAYCCAQAQVSAAKNDKESVRRWLDLGTNADPDNPSVKELRKHFRIR
jgi:predicted Zn-dependent protease